MTKNELIKENNKLKEECERLRVRLAGCGCAAFGYAQDVHNEMWGWSQSLEDVNLLYLKYLKALEIIENNNVLKGESSAILSTGI